MEGFKAQRQANLMETILCSYSHYLIGNRMNKSRSRQDQNMTELALNGFNLYRCLIP